MTKRLKIDFVSDVACPWCVIGLGGLERALDALKGEVEAEIRFQPFELDPTTPAEGRNKVASLQAKYGRTREQVLAGFETIAARAAEVGFDMVQTETSQSFNTFDAHRLIHWAGTLGRQAAMKHALFEAYFTRGENVADAAVLADAAGRAGLDPATAREVIQDGRYADEVRAAEAKWRSAGIDSVPAVVVEERWLISGGQPAAAFEEALRNIAAQA